MSANDEFIGYALGNSVEQCRIDIAKTIAEKVENGFINSDDDCQLSMLCLLQHAFDNEVMFNDEECSKLIYIYNHIANE